MSEGLRVDPNVIDEERIRKEMDEIWERLAKRIPEDDEAIALARRYRELDNQLKGVA